MKQQKQLPSKIILPAVVIFILLIFLTVGFRMFRFAFPKAVHGFYYPYLDLAEKTTGEISDKYLLSLSRIELAGKVEQLLARNRELAVKSSTAAGLLEENRILRRQLRLSPPPNWHYTIAEITLRDPLRFRHGFTIDRGSRDGIAQGDTVVQSTPDGQLLLIGVVNSCMARSSHIITIANPELRISGKTGQSGQIGFINTGTMIPAPGNIRFGMLPLNGDYIQSEAVVTTGYEKGIPEGIKIGELQLESEANVFYSGGTPDLSASLLPAADFERLSFVTVISANQGH